MAIYQNVEGVVREIGGGLNIKYYTKSFQPRGWARSGTGTTYYTYIDLSNEFKSKNMKLILNVMVCDWTSLNSTICVGLNNATNRLICTANTANESVNLVLNIIYI